MTNPSGDTIKPVPEGTSSLRVPFCLNCGTRKPGPSSPKNCLKNGSPSKGSIKSCSTTGTSLVATTLTTAGDASSTTLTTSSSWRRTLSETSFCVTVSFILSSIPGRLNNTGPPLSSPKPKIGPIIPRVKTVPIIETIKLKTTENTTSCLVVG